MLFSIFYIFFWYGEQKSFSVKWWIEQTKDYNNTKKVSELISFKNHLNGLSYFNLVVAEYNKVMKDYCKATTFTTTISRKTRDWQSLYDWLSINKSKYTELFQFDIFVRDSYYLQHFIHLMIWN